MGKEDDANSTDRLARSQALLEFYPTTAQTELNLNSGSIADKRNGPGGIS